MSQTIVVNAKNQALNDVLIGLHKKYNIPFSFNDKLLANCMITDSSSYPSPKEAISALIIKCDFTWEIKNGVYIIRAKINTEKAVVSPQRTNMFSGNIVDKESSEPLPYASIQINNSGIIADVNGTFAFKSYDSIIEARISHLGYFVYDTLLKPATNHRLGLTPSAIGLQEVVVGSTFVLNNSHTGEKPGLLKLNHKVSSFLPGNSDNAIFNLLRLQPGVLAAAEQSNDFIIRGSYAGQNLILFDGIPLFNLSSSNNEMSVINPLIVKDVEVMKGGYNAQLGGRVGGVVNISGNTGNPEKFGASLNVNNQAINGMLNIPMANKYALQLSFRHSFYDLFTWNKPTNSKSSKEEYEPDYRFQDANLKFSGSSKNGDSYSVSLLTNKDVSLFNYSKLTDTRLILSVKEAEKQQFGGSINYNKIWGRAGSTNVSMIYSNLNTSTFDSLEYSEFEKSIALYTENSVSEFALKTSHIFPAIKRHSISTGLEYINNTSGYQEDSINITQKNNIDGAHRLGYYLKDNISISNKIRLQPGIRIDLSTPTARAYIQPRIDVTIRPAERWKINFSWGRYNQFITENAVFDELGNYRSLWLLCDDQKWPVLNRQHYIGGFSYANQVLLWSVEAYYKNTDGLSRFVADKNTGKLTISQGMGRAYGVDFYVKKVLKKHEFWVAYTISKTEELFSYFASNKYQAAPQDQLHELKGAALLNFHPFYISANYVYGSGLAFSSELNNADAIPYNRLDLAMMFRFNANKFELESGLSIVNLLNNSNIRYTDFTNLPGGNTIYSPGKPITPTLFFNIRF